MKLASLLGPVLPTEKMFLGVDLTRDSRCVSASCGPAALPLLLLLRPSSALHSPLALTLFSRFPPQGGLESGKGASGLACRSSRQATANAPSLRLTSMRALVSHTRC